MIIGSIISYSYGEEKKVKWGFSILEGRVMHSTVNPTRRYMDFSPVSVCRIILSLHKNWDLEFEGNYFSYDIHKLHDFYFLGVSHNFLFKPIQERWGSLFLLQRLLD